MRPSRVPPGTLAGILLALACGTRPDTRAAYLQTVKSAEAPLEQAWDRFDTAMTGFDRSAARKAAGEAAAAAVTARDFLETLPLASSLTTARREELIFLNHVILGFQAFAAREARAIDLTNLRSILGRGRIINGGAATR
jgi:hypothetical protein